jgi:PAS domain S-box-containing protein
LALERERATLRAIIEQLPTGVIIAGAAGDVQLTNAAALRLARGDLPATASVADYAQYQCFHLDGRPYALTEYPLARALAGETVVDDEMRVVRLDGSPGQMVFNATPIRDADGAVVAAVTSFNDVTEQRATEARLAESERRFTIAADLAPNPITILRAVRNDAGELVDFTWEYLNPASAQLMPGAPRDWLGLGLLEHSPTTRDTGLFAGYQRVIETGEPYEEEVEWRRGEARRWLRLTASQLGDGLFVSAIDITERRRAEQAQRLLGEASDILAASLDYEATLARVLDLVVPAIADGAILDIFDARDPRVLVAHVDPAKADLLREIRRRYPLGANDAAPVLDVLRQTGGLFRQHVTEDHLRQLARDAEHLRLLRELESRSELVVPLTARGAIFGVLVIGYGPSGRVYAPADLELAQELARRAAQAIENARLFAAERAARAAAEVAQARDAFLADASDVLNVSLDYERTLSDLARVTVGVTGGLADICIVDMLDEQGALRRLAAAHRDPAHDALVREMIANYPPDMRGGRSGGHPVNEVIRSGGVHFAPVVGSALLAQVARDPRHLEILRQLRIASSIIVPLAGRDGVSGAIELLRVEGSPPFNDDDLVTTLELARRAASAIDNARLYRHAQATEEALRRQAARLDALAESARIFAEQSLDESAALEAIAQRVSHLLGDLCVIRLLSDDGGQLLPVAVHHRNPEALALAWNVLQTGPHVVDQGMSGEVLRGGQALLIGDVTDADRAGLMPANLPYIERFGLESIIVVPLRVRGRVIGTLSVARETTGVAYSADDLTLLEDLAQRAALAVDNARLFRQAGEAEARYRALFDGAADGIVVTDSGGQVLAINDAVTRLLGYTLNDLPSSDDLHGAGPDAAQAVRDTLRATGEWRGEAELLRKDGSYVPIEAVARIVPLPDANVAMTTMRDITERRRLERLQQEFMAMVTHELKGPLTSLRGFAQLMQRRGEYHARGVAVIIEQSEQLERLITDLMDAARLDSGRMELRRAPTDLVALVRRCAEQAQALSTRHTLTVETPPEPLMAEVDDDRVSQVLANLLSNAIKYTPDGGPIHVALAIGDTGDVARVSVVDRGLGIPADAQARLFQRFYRVEGARDAFQGLGLGLYISRLLVLAHGGRLSVESVEGEGSTFTFTLPL